MIRCRDVMDFIEQIAPAELAEDWDNVGLMAGSGNSTVERVMVCLDITAAALRRAVSKKADLIVTHHPIIFRSISRICEDDVNGKQIYTAIRNGINIISAHTNLDHADSGVNTQLAAVLGLNNVAVMGEGPGRTGMLDRRLNLDDFICHVKKRLDITHVRVAGKADAGILKVGVFSGSFDGDLGVVRRSEVDAIVTGDLKYHTALDAREANMCIIDAGHFNTERVVLPYLAARLNERFPEAEVISFRQEKDPIITC